MEDITGSKQHGYSLGAEVRATGASGTPGAAAGGMEVVASSSDFSGSWGSSSSATKKSIHVMFFGRIAGGERLGSGTCNHA